MKVFSKRHVSQMIVKEATSFVTVPGMAYDEAQEAKGRDRVISRLIHQGFHFDHLGRAVRRRSGDDLSKKNK